MLKTAIVGLGRGGTGCLRGGKRNIQLKNILEGRLRGICPIENIRTLTTTLSKKNMALEVREELRKKASTNHTSYTEKVISVAFLRLRISRAETPHSSQLL